MAATAFETAAIVLDCREHGESDKIMTFFTRERGRLSGIAKGASRSKKRFVNKLELFSNLTISYSESRHSTLVFIAEAELNHAYLNLRQDILSYTCASIIRETTLMATADHQGDQALFKLLCWSFDALDKKVQQRTIVTIFLLKLYDIIGYRPELSCCTRCGVNFSMEQNYGFSPQAGGLVCHRCQSGDETGQTLSRGTIRLLDDVLRRPLTKLHRLQFSARALEESLWCLHRWGRHLFQREIHSLRALASSHSD